MDKSLNSNLFQYAQYESNQDLIKQEIQAGADINSINENGATALHIATQYHNNNVVEALIELKANLNDKDQNGNTALHYAVMLNNKVAVKALVEVGANPNIKNIDNKTALKIAQERHIAMVKLLLPTSNHQKSSYNKKRLTLNW